jgi:RimJ/RimL family protein N-acetyltransferase
MMAPAEENIPLIRPAKPQELVEALSLVLSHLPQEDCASRVAAVQTECLQGRMSPEGLLVALREDRIVGALFSQVQAGRTAVVWPPRLTAAEPRNTAQELLRAACTRLADQDVQVVHALLENDGGRDQEVLLEGGFEPLANLLYLVSLAGVFPHGNPRNCLEFESYGRHNHQRLASVLEATYEKTLDCPGLDDVRQIEDVLTGYRATGDFSPERWFLVRHQDQDVGCLLLTEHPGADTWELIYMGLIASARGRGWGAEIARFAQWATYQANCSRLVVAVDEANTPAIRIYTAVGFEPWERRLVLQRILS